MGKIFSQNPIFFYTFVQETKFLDSCGGACHCDVTRIKKFDFLYKSMENNWILAKNFTHF